MGYGIRKELYSQLEASRGNPLIVYVTSTRPNLSTHMAGDAILEIIDQVRLIPKERRAVDFLIISNGGDPITAQRIISILRERFDRINVLVPYVAYSAATILALGADEIVMHPFSNLGPVDPQLRIPGEGKDGKRSGIQFSSEDIRNYIDFVVNDVGITEQMHLTTAFNALAEAVGPLPIGRAKRSQQLSLSLSERMLEGHMENKEEAAAVAKTLNTAYFHHGYAVSRREAKEIGLKVVFPGEELEELMWAVWEDFKEEMKCDRPFEPVAEIMSDEKAHRKVQTEAKGSLKISALLASVESALLASAVNSRYNVVFWRDKDMVLKFNVTTHSEGWRKINGD